MSRSDSLAAQREHLANLLEAVHHETDYARVAEHFNELHAMLPVLVGAAARLTRLYAETLASEPATSDFDAEFQQVCGVCDV